MGSKGGAGKSRPGGRVEGALVSRKPERGKQSDNEGTGGISRRDFLRYMWAGATVFAIGIMAASKSIITWNDARIVMGNPGDRNLDGGIETDQEYSGARLEAARQRLVEIMGDSEHLKRWKTAADSSPANFYKCKFLSSEVINNGLGVGVDPDLTHSVALRHFTSYENLTPQNSTELVLGKMEGFEIMGIGVAPDLLTNAQRQPIVENDAKVSAEMIRSLYRTSTYAWLSNNEKVQEKFGDIFSEGFDVEVQIVRLLGNVYGDMLNTLDNPQNAVEYCGMTAELASEIADLEKQTISTVESQPKSHTRIDGKVTGIIGNGYRLYELMQQDLFWKVADNYAKNLPEVDPKNTIDNYTYLRKLIKEPA